MDQEFARLSLKAQLFFSGSKTFYASTLLSKPIFLPVFYSSLHHGRRLYGSPRYPPWRAGALHSHMSSLSNAVPVTSSRSPWSFCYRQRSGHAISARMAHFCSMGRDLWLDTLLSFYDIDLIVRVRRYLFCNCSRTTFNYSQLSQSRC